MSPLLLQLHGKKQHIRALLIDRVLLQHEVSLTTHTHTLPARTHYVAAIICTGVHRGGVNAGVLVIFENCISVSLDAEAGG